ncbi:MAG: M23 family metallopeptidase [Bacteroidetes bacterium]|nr:M23 family metallopeptidase [Bacteroidota bacterium]
MVAGRVIASEFDEFLGNVVRIESADGARHDFFHLNSRSVQQYDTVDVGTILGLAGNTGTSSDGAHLHYARSFLQGSIPERYRYTFRIYAFGRAYFQPLPFPPP